MNESLQNTITSINPLRPPFKLSERELTSAYVNFLIFKRSEDIEILRHHAMAVKNDNERKHNGK
jgi:hypothetical protein